MYQISDINKKIYIKTQKINKRNRKLQKKHNYSIT